MKKECKCGCGTVVERTWAPGHNRRGATMSPEARAKIGAAHRGTKRGPLSAEARQKMSDAKRGEKHPFWGKKRPDSVRRAVAESKRGAKNPQYKAVRYTITETGCWEWQLNVTKKGYGLTWRGDRMVAAHRAYYEEHVGPVPAGFDLHHTCRNRRCVNPAHLRPVSKEEHKVLHGTTLPATDRKAMDTRRWSAEVGADDGSHRSS